MERIEGQLQRKYVVDQISNILITSLPLIYYLLLLLIYYRLKQYFNSQRYAFHR